MKEKIFRIKLGLIDHGSNRKSQISDHTLKMNHRYKKIKSGEKYKTNGPEIVFGMRTNS